VVRERLLNRKMREVYRWKTCLFSHDGRRDWVEGCDQGIGHGPEEVDDGEFFLSGFDKADSRRIWRWFGR